ncbi:MAG: shikimate kinase [Clostridia bacterium]|nr:shikimate kinase [Clostridia bacterium]
MNKDNIILIGMPGCGKSTLGVLLAKTLLKSFVDTDLLIQQQEGKELYKIIAEKGKDAFSEIENQAVARVKCHNSIIATGGSVVFGEDAMKNLKSLGTVVYLKLPLHEIERRVRNIRTRGIVMAPGQTLASVFNERAPLYEKYADITVHCSRAPLEKTVEKIIRALGE